MADYSAHIGTNSTLPIYVKYSPDGHRAHCSFRIRSIERRNHPNPNVVRGILTIDLNRPGEDASSMPADADVVIEVWSYPKTLIYTAEEYEEAEWALLGDVLPGQRFIFCADDDIYDTTSVFIKTAEERVVPVSDGRVPEYLRTHRLVQIVP